MICATSLSLSLGGKAILDDVSMQLRPGQVTALCGPNGAGKSTLLACLAGEHAACAQAVSYDKVPLNQLSARDLAGKRVVLEQSPSLSADFLVDELIELSAPLTLSSAELDQIMAEVTDTLGIKDMRDRPVKALSGGQQHRAHLARVLVQLEANRSLGHNCALFLDEPTASLDLGHQIAVMRLAKDLAKDDIGVLVVLHDLNLAAAFADHVILMKAGRITHQGAPEEVLTQPIMTETYETPIMVEIAQSGQRVIQPLL